MRRPGLPFVLSVSAREKVARKVNVPKRMDDRMIFIELTILQEKDKLCIVDEWLLLIFLMGENKLSASIY